MATKTYTDEDLRELVKMQHAYLTALTMSVEAAAHEVDGLSGFLFTVINNATRLREMTLTLTDWGREDHIVPDGDSMLPVDSGLRGIDAALERLLNTITYAREITQATGIR